MSILSCIPIFADHRPPFPYPILVALAFITPVLALFNSKALVPLLIVAVLIALAAHIRRSDRPTIQWSWLGRATIVFVVWIFISLGWSDHIDISAKGALKFSGNLILAYLSLRLLITTHDDNGVQTVSKALITGFIIVVIILFFEGMSGGQGTSLVSNRKPTQVGLYWLNHANTVLALLAWPVAILLWRRSVMLATGAILVVAGAAWVIKFDTLLISMGMSIIAWAAMYYAPRIFRPLGVVCLGLYILAGPLTLTTYLKPVEMAKIASLPNPLVHRFHIWTFTSDKIAERPITGHGINTSRTMSNRTMRAQDEVRGDYGELLPIHPHNFVLQIWLELGAIGAVLFAAVSGLLFLWLTANSFSRIQRAVSTAQFSIVVALLSSSFGILQSWFLAALWIVAAVTATVLSQPQRS